MNVDTLIPAGIYRLTRDVESTLLRDRRQRYDWTRRGKWRAGTRFIVEHNHLDFDDLRVVVVRLYDAERTKHLLLQRMVNDKLISAPDQFKADVELAGLIFAACEPAKVETFDDLYSQHVELYPDAARAVLKALVETDRVSLVQVQALYKRAADGSIYDILGESDDA